MNDKSKRATRRSRTETAIKKQLRIAKSMGVNHVLDQPHRLAKHHALDCGNPECLVCHSEKVFHKPTLQEKKFIESHKMDNFDSCNPPE